MNTKTLKTDSELIEFKGPSRRTARAVIDKEAKTVTIDGTFDFDRLQEDMNHLVSSVNSEEGDKRYLTISFFSAKG